MIEDSRETGQHAIESVLAVMYSLQATILDTVRKLVPTAKATLDRLNISDIRISYGFPSTGTIAVDGREKSVLLAQAWLPTLESYRKDRTTLLANRTEDGRHLSIVSHHCATWHDIAAALYYNTLRFAFPPVDTGSKTDADAAGQQLIRLTWNTTEYKQAKKLLGLTGNERDLMVSTGNGSLSDLIMAQLATLVPLPAIPSLAAWRTKPVQSTRMLKVSIDDAQFATIKLRASDIYRKHFTFGAAEGYFTFVKDGISYPLSMAEPTTNEPVAPPVVAAEPVKPAKKARRPESIKMADATAADLTVANPEQQAEPVTT